MKKNLTNNLYEYEQALINKGYNFICGVDEVGRGCIAGPLVVSAVILPLNIKIEGLNDSKKLNAKKRQELFDIIQKEAIAISTVFVSEEKIEEYNIYQATKKAMIKAIKDLKVKPEHALIDAMNLECNDIEYTPIKKGDSLSLSIAAASVIAKVTRDNYMIKMHSLYPMYGFDRHKGYCTKLHVKSLEENKPCEIHRKSFYPVSKYF